MEALISVIVPVYNAAPWLGRCVESLRAQTYKNIEIILIDDDSSDGSDKICQEFAKKDARVKLLHKKNGGVSSTRNAGLREAKGSYISFVDADDHIEPDMYALLHGLLEACAAEIAGCENAYEESLSDETQSVRVYAPREALEKDFGGKGLFACNKLFSKEVLEGLFFDENISVGEDMLFCFNAIIRAKKIVYTNLKKYHYNRNNANSATLRKFHAGKLTYFKASEQILKYAADTRDNRLHKLVLNARIYHTAGFLRQAASAGYEERAKEFAPMLKELRRGILGYLFSNYKITNKCFALALCLGYASASKIYRLYERCKDEK